MTLVFFFGAFLALFAPHVAVGVYFCLGVTAVTCSSVHSVYECVFAINDVPQLIHITVQKQSSQTTLLLKRSISP